MSPQKDRQGTIGIKTQIRRKKYTSYDVDLEILRSKVHPTYVLVKSKPKLMFLAQTVGHIDQIVKALSKCRHGLFGLATADRDIRGLTTSGFS